MKRKRTTPEDDCQMAIVKHLKRVERTGQISFFHVPNQLGRTPTLRIIMANLGVRSGVSDLVILIKPARCIFVELKMKGKKPTKVQEAWRGTVEALGFDYYLVTMENRADGIKQILNILREYGVDIP